MILRRVYARPFLVLLAGGLVVLGLLFAAVGYKRTLRLWNIPVTPIPFADTRVVTASAEARARGRDPLLDRVGDIFNPTKNPSHQFDYPRVWVLLSYLGVREKDTDLLGFIFAGLFFGGVVLLACDISRWPPAWFMAACLFSPAVFYGLDAGNNDLVIFFLLALSVWLLKRSRVASAILIALAFVLKLFPIVAISAFLRESRRLFLWTLLASVLLVGAYVAIMHNELKLIGKAVPHLPFGAYGVDTAWMELQLGHHHNGEGLVHAVRIASYAAAALIVLLSLVHAGRETYVRDARDTHIDAFRVGASIYVATFLMTASWDYRLMFLLFAVPQLSVWATSPKRYARRAAIVTLASAVISLWALVLAWLLAHIPLGGYASSVLNLAAKEVLFAGFFYLLVFTCPEWVKAAGMGLRLARRVPGPRTGDDEASALG
jgi:Glycosyltransferase family 87